MAINLIGCEKGDFDQCLRALGTHVVPEAGLSQASFVAHVAAIDAVLLENVGSEAFVLLGHHGQHLFRLWLAVAPDHGVGYQHVDAEGMALDALFDPRELLVELLGGHADGSENTHAPRLRHLDDDIFAVSESQQRKLDTEQVTDPSVHRLSLFETRRVGRSHCRNGAIRGVILTPTDVVDGRYDR